MEHQQPGKGTSAAAASPSSDADPSADSEPDASAAPAARVPVTVPVYYLGTEVNGLFREFRRTAVPKDTPVGAMNQAVRLAVDPASPARAGDVSPWLTGTSQAAVWRTTARPW